MEFSKRDIAHGEAGLVFEAETADFVEQGFVGDAEFFRGAGFIPLSFLQGVLDFEPLDMRDGALRDFVERAFP